MNERRSTDGRLTVSLATSKDKHTSKTTQGQKGHLTRALGITLTDQRGNTSQ